MKTPSLRTILIVAVGLRGLLLGMVLMGIPWGVGLGGAWTPDSEGYWVLGRSIVEDGSFSRPLPEDRPEVFRTPGYPALAGLFLTTLGTGAAGVAGLLIVQVLMGVGVVYLTYRLGRRLIGPRAGPWAALWQAIAPVALAANVRFLADGPYTLLLTAAMLLMVRHLQERSWRPLVAAAALMGLAAYVRPVGLAMAAVMGVALLARPGRLARVGAWVGILAAMTAPWVARNAIVADYAGFSSFATGSLHGFAVPKVLARVKDVPEQEIVFAQAIEMMAFEAEHPDATAGEIARFRRRRAFEVLAEHPKAYAIVHLKGCMAFWLPGATDVAEAAGLSTGQRGTLAVLQAEGLWAAARHYFGGNRRALLVVVPLGLIWAAKLACALVGAVRHVRLRLPAEVWMLIGMVALAALAGGPASTPRFRVPVEPILSVLAAAAFVRRGQTAAAPAADASNGAA